LTDRDDHVLLALRVVAVNSGAVPRYAWFKGLCLTGAPATLAPYDGATGQVAFSTGRVLGVQLLDGQPLPQPEMAILLQPGATTTLTLLVPHQPLAAAAAAGLAAFDFEAHLAACRAYWQAKLASAATIEVPERAIQERLQAGLLHLDLVTIGKEPGGPVLATVGWYAPIGSESSPMIQYYDSVGWHQLAERSLQFFFDRQRPDGFIQNYGGYQLETGPVLWTAGEHYRYTRDDAWVERVQPHLLKACEYLIAWRQRSCREEFRGRGYGLQDGKVADPQDFYHSFMLNALSCLGIQRVAEMLAHTAPAEARCLAAEATTYRADLRKSFLEALARSPAIPTGNGTWVPAPPPWAEYPGALALYAEGGLWATHHAIGARDSPIGSLYLLLGDVLSPHEPATTFLLKSHHELFTVANASLSQPYYCRHDYGHLIRDEVPAFLKTFYNQVTALQDRETYTFWEHYFGASQHKTHEEGWFLMQTRWMLWLEQGDTLSLLRAIPRRWLADGKSIILDQVASYFGPFTLKVESRDGARRITAQFVCNGDRKPKTVALRLPHPDALRATRVEGGDYDVQNETVLISPFKGQAKATLCFD
jgi:hypothetical protein